MESTFQFLLITLFLEATPGPAVLFILFQSSLGMRHVMAAIAGLLTANVIWISLAGSGLGLIITGSPMIYDTVRFCGAIYLIYLGYKIIRYGFRPPDMSEGVQVKSYRKSYLHGMLTSLSNPKALIFFMVILVNFVSQDNLLADLLYFGVLKMLCLFCIMCAYGLAGNRIFTWVDRKNMQRWVGNILGGGIILAAIALAIG